MDKIDEFLDILNVSVNEIYIFDQQSLKFCWVNKIALTNLQYTMHELHHMTPLTLKKDFDDSYFKKLLAPLYDGSKHKIEFETTHERKDKSRYDVQVHLQKGLFEDKPVYIAIILDISELNTQKAFIQSLEHKEKDLSRILDQSQNEIYIFSQRTLKFMWANQKALKNLDLSLKEIARLTPLDLKPDYTLQSFKQLLSTIKHDEQKIVFYTRHLRSDRSLYDVEVHLQKGFYQNKRVYVAVILDITERKEKEQLIQRLIQEKNHESLHDFITQLPNRRALEKCLETKTANRIFNPDEKFAVIFIDLDNFKKINDTQGHQLGDELLRLVSERLKTHLSSGDFLARFGGDEFVIVRSDDTSTDKLSSFCETLLSSLTEPFALKNMTFSISASIGVALAPEDANTPNKLIECADFAQYSAKQGGKNQSVFYDEKQHHKFINHVGLVSKIMTGIEENEFSFVLQPIIEIASGNIIGAEFLIRWKSDNKIISPNHFIPLLEETSTINLINEWFVEQVSTFIQHSKAALPKPFKFCLNATYNQMSQLDLYDNLKKIIKNNHLNSVQLEVEITENALTRNIQRTRQYLDTLKSLGINIAIDDFGSGYSSLQTLKTLPISALKIDQNFIHGIESEINQGIIKTILTLAKTLKIDAVAEGVETKAQLSTLLNLLDESELPRLYGQGFYFYKPMSPEIFLKTLSG